MRCRDRVTVAKPLTGREAFRQALDRLAWSIQFPQDLAQVGGDFRVRATVRASHTGGDHIPRLSLRFEDGSAPDRLVQTDDAREATHTMRNATVSNSSAAASASWTIAL